MAEYPRNSDGALENLVNILYGALVAYIFFIFAKDYISALQRGLIGVPSQKVLWQSIRFLSFVAFIQISMFAIADAGDVVKRNRMFPLEWNSRFLMDVLVIAAYFFTLKSLEWTPYAAVDVGEPTGRSMHFVPGLAVTLAARWCWGWFLVREHGGESGRITSKQREYFKDESAWLAFGAVIFGVMGFWIVNSETGLGVFSVHSTWIFLSAFTIWWLFWIVVQLRYSNEAADELSVLPVPRVRRKK